MAAPAHSASGAAAAASSSSSSSGGGGSVSKRLEELRFDNLALRTLPIDKETRNFTREVSGACFSLVNPEPVKNPRLVCYSPDVLKWIEVDEKEVQREDFAEYFAGNKLLPGTRPAAHCYCGHQFGHFSGQLGDGATMYLGEIVTSKDERIELQFKGAGKTPYSRRADGRKVLRSSLREFLCSEAHHYLGIPTTRAGTIVTSDTPVVRDIFYDGNAIEEKATVITRLAPSFIRFGSFEIAKGVDSITGRAGPSAGRTAIIQQLLDYVVDTFYSDVISGHSSREEQYLAFFRELTRRTAMLVARWQCVGWAHGVLNCFPAEDHEVLTRHGFMSLAAIEAHLAQFGTVDVATWQSGALVYVPIDASRVVKKDGQHVLIPLEQARTETAASDGRTWSRWGGVSLRPTDNHRMWVRLGSTVGAAYGQRRWRGRRCKAPPFTIVPAAELHAARKDPSMVAQLTAKFERGYDGGEFGALPFRSVFGLTTDDEVAAFLELYGYWLGDGWLDGLSRSIEFGPKKVKDWDYLDTLLARLVRVLPTDKAGRGVFIAPRPEVKKGRGGIMVGIRVRRYAILELTWWTAFAAEYGHKYAKAYALGAAEASYRLEDSSADARHPSHSSRQAARKADRSVKYKETDDGFTAQCNICDAFDASGSTLCAARNVMSKHKAKCRQQEPNKRPHELIDAAPAAAASSSSVPSKKVRTDSTAAAAAAPSSAAAAVSPSPSPLDVLRLAEQVERDRAAGAGTEPMPLQLAYERVVQPDGLFAVAELPHAASVLYHLHGPKHVNFGMAQDGTTPALAFHILGQARERAVVPSGQLIHQLVPIVWSDWDNPTLAEALVDAGQQLQLRSGDVVIGKGTYAPVARLSVQAALATGVKAVVAFGAHVQHRYREVTGANPDGDVVVADGVSFYRAAGVWIVQAPHPSEQFGAKVGRVAAALLVAQTLADSGALSESAHLHARRLAVEQQRLAAEDINSAKWFWYWVWRLSSAQLRHVLRGLRFADGDEARDCDGGAIYTSSVRFRDEIHRAAVQAGCSAIFYVNVEAGANQGKNPNGVDIVATKTGWAVAYSDERQVSEPKLSLATECGDPEPYKGLVWCVSVPTEQQLIMFRRVLKRDEAGQVQEASRPVVVGNTDNLSILGLTIDYGPFGFMESFDPQYICNASDNEGPCTVEVLGFPPGRYRFEAQPEICGWNLLKLSQNLEPFIPRAKLRACVDEYEDLYLAEYNRIMRNKFGVGLHVDAAKSAAGQAAGAEGEESKQPDYEELASDFHEAMADTGSDFTNSFRALSRLDPSDESSYDRTLNLLVSQCCTVATRVAALAPRIPAQQMAVIMRLMQTNPAMFQRPGMEEQLELINAEIARAKQREEGKKQTQQAKEERDRTVWRKWLDSYVAVLRSDLAQAQRLYPDRTAADLYRERVLVQNGANPKYILRNWIAQTVIDGAEKGDYAIVAECLERLRDPYDIYDRGEEAQQQQQTGEGASSSVAALEEKAAHEKPGPSSPQRSERAHTSLPPKGTQCAIHWNKERPEWASGLKVT